MKDGVQCPFYEGIRGNAIFCKIGTVKETCKKFKVKRHIAKHCNSKYLSCGVVKKVEKEREQRISEALSS